MKIEIDYNGTFAVCRIEPMEELGKMVNFNEADAMSQIFALQAFNTIEGHWRREKQLKHYKQHAVMHIKREFQLTHQNLEQLHELSYKGIVLTWALDITKSPDISLLLKDGTTLTTGDWLLEDMEGQWRGMNNGEHRMLEHYQKIIVDGS